MDLLLVTGFLAATLRIASPLLLAATGELIAERAGVLNLGIEGAMLAGALASALAGTMWGPEAGVIVAVLAGMMMTSIVALIAVRARADQVITGTAVTLGAVGLTGAIYRMTLGAENGQQTLETLRYPWTLTLLACAAVPLCHFTFYR